MRLISQKTVALLLLGSASLLASSAVLAEILTLKKAITIVLKGNPGLAANQALAKLVAAVGKENIHE